MKSIYAVILASVCLLPALRGEEIKFKKTQLDTEFRSEGVTVFDVNKDKKMDIVTDQFWYEAPNWMPHEIRKPQTYTREPNQYSDCFSCFPMDVNGDGFTDVITVNFPGAPMHWYENPKGKDGHWEKHVLFFSCANESPAFLDINGDKKNDMIMGIHSDKAKPEQQKAMIWCSPDPSDPNKPWIAHQISGPNSPGGDRFSHGLGVGDVNGDGRADLLISAGWYEAPADPTQSNWKFHPLNIPTCAQMYVYDVNGDKRPDIICSNAHKIGVWWFEQGSAEEGKEPSWTKHEIDTSFSESHAMRFEDIDRDKVPEIITGKRFYSHGKGGEPGWDGPALLVYYKLEGKGANAKWVRHDIDNDSGVATQFEVKDVNGDKRLDIIISSKKGLFYFEQQK